MALDIRHRTSYAANNSLKSISEKISTIATTFYGVTFTGHVPQSKTAIVRTPAISRAALPVASSFGILAATGALMHTIHRLLTDTPLPAVARIRQHFPATSLDNPAVALREAMNACPAIETLKPGMRIALTVGSRGLCELPLLVRTIVEELKARGAMPFIVPAMGSHGGATAEGQTALLAALGVTEHSAGCSIRSGMETVEIGRLPNGMSVRMDSLAMEADGILVFNRIKPHNAFRHDIESGLAKMLAIGLGNQSGADSCHAWGFAHIGSTLVDMARMKLERCPVLMGIATVENAYDRIARVVAVTPQELLEREAEELRFAKTNMPCLLVDPLDVLVVDQVGKEFSGGGMDANIIGTAASGIVMSDAAITRIAVLDVSEHSLGNANGIGLAAVITQRLYEKIDLVPMYANAITAKSLKSVAIPMIMPDDKLAVQAAVKTSTPKDLAGTRLMRIPNTLHLGEAYISEALMAEAKNTPGIDVLGDARPMVFSAQGQLCDPWNFAP